MAWCTLLSTDAGLHSRQNNLFAGVGQGVDTGVFSAEAPGWLWCTFWLRMTNFGLLGCAVG